VQAPAFRNNVLLRKSQEKEEVTMKIKGLEMSGR
jgi:hypothetical protein